MFTPIINTISIVIGSLIGIFIKKGVPKNIQNILFYAVGLSTIGLSLTMILKTNNFLIVLSSLAIGGIIGELINIEGKLKKIGDTIKEGDFSTGFVTSSLLFLVGPLTIIGSITAGLTNDGSLIYMKSLLDGISSIVLSSIYGLGVLLSGFSVLVIQGLLVIFSSKLSFLTTPAYLNDLIAAGGVMVLGIGLKILEIKDTRVGNFLPALLICPLLVFLVNLF
ncbi:membrane protein [Thermosipho affectus]|uniref:Membrane protein n=1 Tax=Thermosipho affectus TaxID=660294 RepID=A0ABX3IIA0_9BACT|nr:membrane protein [Thermosipho sp. 1063]ONN26902.1 membrane protein [Thermosipho affectus]OOC42659.1 membrane protein [Thermosipho sp. 1074]